MNATPPVAPAGLYDIAAPVRAWRAAGRPVLLARTVSVAGGSSRWPNQAVAFTPGRPPTGTLLAGAVDAELHAAAQASFDGGVIAATLTLPVEDRAAATAGMACGGTVRVLLQPAGQLPDRVWGLLAAREPLCLVTELTGPTPGRTTWFTTSTTPDDGKPDQAVRLFGRGVNDSTVLEGGAGGQPKGAELLLAALWPTPRLLIVGDGLLAGALADQAELLGWAPSVTTDVETASDAAAALTRTDGVIVLTHARAVDGPVLAAALTGSAGYLGALGSRRTQQARAGWLTEHGVGADAIASIRGPAGLDIGSRTPAEIALAVAAEMLAVRHAATGTALRDASGPIHRDSLNTPPARYPRP